MLYTLYVVCGTPKVRGATDNLSACTGRKSVDWFDPPNPSKPRRNMVWIPTKLLWMIGVLHDLICRNPGSCGSIVYMESYRMYFTSSRRPRTQLDSLCAYLSQEISAVQFWFLVASTILDLRSTQNSGPQIFHFRIKLSTFWVLWRSRCQAAGNSSWK